MEILHNNYISLEINNRTLELSTDRIEKMIVGNKEDALYMGLWDRFKDFFRYEKKADALQEMYDLIHDHHTENQSPFLSSIVAFERIKSLAHEEFQPLFNIEVDNERYHYLLNSVQLCEKHFPNLSKSEKSFFELYQLEKHPLDAEAIRQEFTKSLEQRILSGSFSRPEDQLLKDFPRNKYEIIYSTEQSTQKVTYSNDDGIDPVTKNQALRDFLAHLTPEQIRSLNVVGAQIAPIEMKGTLPYIAPTHAFIGNPKASYQLMLNESSDGHRGLMVNVIVEQDHEIEYFNTLKEFTKSDSQHPELSLQASYTIQEDGMIDCVDFHFNRYTGGLASCDLSQDEQNLPATFNFLKNFVSDLKNQWFIRNSDSIYELDNERKLREFYAAHLAESICHLPLADQKKMLTHLSSDFGCRLRGAIEFAGKKITDQATYDTVVTSNMKKYSMVLEELMTVLQGQLGNEVSKPALPTPTIINHAHQLTLDEKLGLSLLGINLDALEDNAIS